MSLTPEQVDAIVDRFAITDVVNRYFDRVEESDEIVLYDHPGSFTPVIHGDTAEADVRVRSMHYGVGPRQGKFYESLAVMSIRLVRTPDGWRFTHYDWKISVRLGNLGELYAPELERMGRRFTSSGSVPITS
jgi:hypothetical protein